MSLAGGRLVQAYPAEPQRRAVSRRNQQRLIIKRLRKVSRIDAIEVVSLAVNEVSSESAPCPDSRCAPRVEGMQHFCVFDPVVGTDHRVDYPTGWICWARREDPPEDQSQGSGGPGRFELPEISSG